MQTTIRVGHLYTIEKPTIDKLILVLNVSVLQQVKCIKIVDWTSVHIHYSLPKVVPTRSKINTILVQFCTKVNHMPPIESDILQKFTRLTRSNTISNICTPNIVNKDSHKFSFFPRTTTDWHALPPSIKLKPSLNLFKELLKSCY